MAKQKIRDAWRSVRTQSRLTVTQIAATSLAAITMAIVSARLTSFSSSILIVGVISAISAMSSEFYRIIITASAESTKKVVAPVLGSEAAGTSGESADSVDTTQTQVLSGTHGTPSLNATLVSGATSDVTTTVSVETPSTEEDGAAGQTGTSGNATERGGGRKHPLVYALFHNQLLQMSIIFLIVALITVGVSYGVARAQGKTEINNNYTTVEQTLTEEEKARITEEAAQIAKDQALQNSVDQKTSEQTTTDQTTPDLPTTDPSADPNPDGSVQTELDALKAENEGLRTSVDTLTRQLEAEKVRTDDLAARLEALEQALAAQGAQAPEG